MENNVNDQIDSTLSSLKRGISNGTKSPHKLIFLLTIIQLYENGRLQNRFPLDTEMDETFKKLWIQFVRAVPYSKMLIELPFFYLQSDGLWTLKIKDGKQQEITTFPRLTRARIYDCIEYGFLNSLWFDLISDSRARSYLKASLIARLGSNELATNPNDGMEYVAMNNFVSYVNTLHCIDANSDGALAERQAKEPLFCKIQIPHELSAKFYNDFLDTDSNKHIVLTGHAGDGKSTIALELFKLLKGIPQTDILIDGIPKRADFEHNAVKITIIKDLSEWTTTEQDDVFRAMIKQERRFFLISNSGCLLDLFKRHADVLQSSPLEIESKLLTAMDSGKSEQLTFDELHVEINNLALRDNIDLAMKLWTRLVSAIEWDDCQHCRYYSTCPVYRNIKLIQKYQTRITERLRLLLKRLYEYGSRLTLRQLSAHFSYMLCSGFDCEKMHKLAQSGVHINWEEFLFFNRFFGDAGGQFDIRSKQLYAVGIINSQGFETVQSPGIERYLWLNDLDSALTPEIPELDGVYKRLHAIAIRDSEDCERSLYSHNARKQIRRLFYFLYTPAADKQKKFANFLSSFLNSPMLLEYEKWQSDLTLFSRRRATLLEQIFAVLQEQFSGIKVPEGAMCSDKTLYITLARRQRDIRQSAQIVLGKISFGSTFDVKIEQDNSGCNVIFLVSNGLPRQIRLELPLPFLDYIAMRKNGEIGNALRLSYIDRLENLKNQILEYATLSEENGMMLLKQDAQHELQQQRLRIELGRLEVSRD